MSAPAEWVPDAPELGPVGEGPVDWPGLEAHVRAELPGLRGELTVERFVRGGLHDAYRLRFGATLLVVRNLAKRPQGAADRHLTLVGIARAYDRAPAPLLLCEDPAVAGVAFEVLQYQPGFVIADRLPNAFVNEPDAGRRIATAVVAALAELHALEGGPVHGSFSLARCQFNADAEGGTPDRVTGVLGWDHVRASGGADDDLRSLVASWPGEALGLPSGDELAAMHAAATGMAAGPADRT